MLIPVNGHDACLDDKPRMYRGELKGLYVLLSRTQAEQLSKSRKKILATTCTSLIVNLCTQSYRTKTVHFFDDDETISRPQFMTTFSSSPSSSVDRRPLISAGLAIAVTVDDSSPISGCCFRERIFRAHAKDPESGDKN